MSVKRSERLTAAVARRLFDTLASSQGTVPIWKAICHLALGYVPSVRSEGLPQRMLAERAGVSPNTISLIERDETSPSVATLQQLAAALDVKMSYFFESTTLARILHVHAAQRPVIRGAGLTIEGLGAA